MELSLTGNLIAHQGFEFFEFACAVEKSRCDRGSVAEHGPPPRKQSRACGPRLLAHGLQNHPTYSRQVGFRVDGRPDVAGDLKDMIDVGFQVAGQAVDVVGQLPKLVVRRDRNVMGEVAARDLSHPGPEHAHVPDDPVAEDYRER